MIDEYIDMSIVYPITTITLLDVDKTQKYTIEVVVQADMDNDSTTPTLEVTKTYQKPPVNEHGISLGAVSAVKNSINAREIDLIFLNSYNLTNITKISYSVYNTTGYSSNGGPDSVIWTPVLAGTESYYKYTLPIQLPLGAYGNYIIELRFWDAANNKVEEITLEYLYTN